MPLSSIIFAVPSPRRDTPGRMSFVKRLAAGIERLGTPVHQFRVVKSANPFEFVRQGLALRRLARTTSASLVVAQFGSYTGLLVAVFAKHPTVMTFRGSDLNPEPNTPYPVLLAQHAASHLASLRADGIVCVSQELADRLRVRTRRAVIPSPTDVELFRPMDRAECRAALGWPAAARIAVFFGGNNPALKGIDLAREVRAELEQRRSPVELRIIADEIPLADMPVHLNAADCLVFLSRFEGSPNLIRDACACNLPIVASPAGDIGTVLRDVRPHRLVNRASTDVADAVEALCTGSRSNGRDAVAGYATAIAARRSLDFYTEIVERGGA